MVDTISFRCDACEANLQVPGNIQAKSTICMHCGAKVKVPVMFEGPAITYDDAPPAPEVFRAPPVYVEQGPDPRQQRIRLAIIGAAICLVIGLIGFAVFRGGASTEPSPEAVAQAQARTQARVQEQARAQEQAAAAAAATAAAKRQAAKELEALQQEKERLKRELASARAVTVPAPTPAVETPALATVVPPTEVVVQAAPEPKVELPSYEQLQKDLKRNNAEMLVARSRLIKLQEDLGFTKGRIATGLSEIERAEASLRSQEVSNKHATSSPSYSSSDTRASSAAKLEEQWRTKINRLKEEQDKRSVHLLEVENQIPALEEELRLATERLATTKEMIKQVAPAAPAAPTTAAVVPAGVPAVK